jgi:ATP-dependent RNA helicase RhlE
MQTKTHRHSRSGSKTSHQKRTARPFPQRGKSSQGGRGGNRGNSRFTHSRGNRGGGRKMPTFDPSKFINTNPVEHKTEAFTPVHTFATFGLDKRLVASVQELGITSPSPIQDEIIPLMLDNHDVIGLAETGTGKTAAFLLPIIHKTLKDDRRQTLIVTPTRELALQIDVELRKLTKGMKIYSTVCVGGAGIGAQIKGLKRKNHFIIGTPGRLLDLIRRRKYSTEYVRTVVLDEADRMLDMGFIHDIRSILKATPRERETHFFSATIDKNTRDLVHEFLRDPVTVTVKKSDVTNSIEQDVVRYGREGKYETLLSLLKDDANTRTIIFGAMKHRVQKLADDLNKSGIRSEAIHGNKSHGQRQRALSNFKGGRVQVLVATDVAARGIHVDDVSHVINYDLPSTFEDYVHRIGRTGRSDKRGKALTFVDAGQNNRR